MITVLVLLQIKPEQFSITMNRQPTFQIFMLQYNLGWKYFNGENVYKDVSKAFNLYDSASRYGHPQATFNLANMYYSGVGTVKNIKKAYKLFLLAKISGIGESQYFLNKIEKQISPEELMVLTSEYGSLIERKLNFL